MRNVGRAFGLGVVILVGCADATFDLLPKKADRGPDKLGQSGDTGDTTGTGDTGSGDVSATGGSAGFGARGGAGGSMDIGMGGVGNDTNCGPNGCVPNTCNPEQGCCNRNDDCATPTPYCGTKHRCVNCRPTYDCPSGENCSRDCKMGEICDGATNTCAPACDQAKPCLSQFLQVCQRGLCVECDPNVPTKFGCKSGLMCAPYGKCVECFSSNDCHDEAKAVCDFETLECGPCVYDYECNPSGTPYGATCDSGRCVAPMTTPMPTPPPSP